MMRRAGLILAAVLLVLGSQITLAVAQGSKQEIRLNTPVKYGESCRRLNDGRDGVFKRDACGRTYCGLTDVKDIIELRPNFAAEHACTWQLAGADCKCLKASRP